MKNNKKQKGKLRLIQIIRRINLKNILRFLIIFILIVFYQSGCVFAEEIIQTDNAGLKILRLNYEGITPEFEKEIKEYYFIADMSINELEITAIPENEKATVKITGNTELKEGLNIIDIKVESEDKTKTEIYKIYVTKTENKELANSNLENLAIRQGTLEPTFQANITHYYIELANEISKLDILAIAQNMNAEVTVEGNNGLKIGDNTITVNVKAEDGITNKKYVITAHRRNEQEETQEEAEQEKQQEQVAMLLENSESYTSTRLSSEIKGTVPNIENMKTEDVVTFTLLGIVLVGFLVMFAVERMKRK